MNIKQLNFKYLIGGAIKPFQREWLFVTIVTLLLAPVCTFGLLKLLALNFPPSLWHDLAGLARLFLIVYVLAAIIVFFKARWLKYAVYVLSMVTFLVSLILDSLFKLEISPKVIQLLAETTSDEVTGFFKAFFGFKMAAGLAAFVVGIVAIVWLERHKRAITDRIPDRIRSRLHTVVAVIVPAAIIGGVISFGSVVKIFSASDVKTLEGAYPGHHSDDPSKLLFSIKSIDLVADDTARWLANVRASGTEAGIATDTIASDTLDVVVVIGESYIRRHSPLYGYQLATTPFQSSEAAAGRLVAFDSVTTMASTTSVALRSIFSLSSKADGEQDFTARVPFFPMLFKAAGWEVYMIDNQHSADAAIYTFTLSSMLYNSCLTDSCYTYFSTYSNANDDLDFVRRERASSVARDGSAKRLWIYHLWGQHVPASDRFPDTAANRKFDIGDYAFRTETWLTDAQRREIADYDNATLYNDKVLREILLNHSDRPTVAVYFSDHGEEVYDFRPSSGRVGISDEELADADFARNYLEAIYHVPFMVWASDRYLERFPARMAQIREISSRPATTDLVGYMLLNLAGISTPAYVADRDVLSGAYHTHRGMTAEMIPE